MFFLETQGRFQVPKKALREGFPSEVLAATLGSPSAGLRYHGSDLSTKLKLLGVTWYFSDRWCLEGSAATELMLSKIPS